jgi:hypothetical protein
MVPFGVHVIPTLVAFMSRGSLLVKSNGNCSAAVELILLIEKAKSLVMVRARVERVSPAEMDSETNFETHCIQGAPRLTLSRCV